MKKILITGITGFVGTHLLNFLRDKDFQIFGTSLSSEKEEGNIKIFKLDLLDEESVAKVLKDTSPDYIIHLAALASPKKSFDNPKEFLHNNTDVQLNLLEGIKKITSNPRVLVISSGEIYGQQEILPINEKASLRPTSPYSVSKITQDYLALQYFLAAGMDIVRARPFNHIGPGQADDFVVASFAKQIAEVEKGIKPVVKVGNLEAKRDFTDVRDMIKAYLLLLDKGNAGEVYNIGSGKSYKIQFILDTLIEMSGKKICIEEDPARMRPSDIPDIVCDTTKINSATSWKTEIPIEDTLRDTLDYWRGIV